MSLSDGASWGDDLHVVHRRVMLTSDCSTCHGSSRFPVSLDSFNAGTGLAPINCVGCHGREEDIGNDSESTGRGAGFRQHHTNGPYSGTVSLPVQFDGSGSSDPDGAIVTYDWDFDDDSTGAGHKPVVLKLVVKNNSTVEGTALATITGVQNGAQVYNETLTVTNGVGGGASTFDNESVPAILAFVPTAAGDILWTVTIDDNDPDLDEITAVTNVVP